MKRPTIQSLTAYLAAAGGNHEAALKLMSDDLTALNNWADTNESEGGGRDASIRTRTLSRVLTGVAEKLGVTIPAGTLPEGAEQAIAGQLTERVTALTGSETALTTLRAGLTAAGIQGDDIQAAVTARISSETAPLLHQATLSDYAREHGLDVKRLGELRSSDRLERREIEVEGKKVPTWVVRDETGDGFKPASEILAPMHAGLTVTPQPQGQPWVNQAGGNQSGNVSPFAVQANQPAQQQQQGQPAAPKFSF